jgi:recombination protein RecT
MAVSNQITQSQSKNTFSNFMTSPAVVNKVNNMVGGKDGQRFITAIVSAVSSNNALQECDFTSIMSAAMLGESLKLSPSPQLGQYYMVPYNNKKKGTKDAQFQLGYKGYIQLAIRSGYYKKINVVSIKEGELISYDPLNEEIDVKLIENPLERENAKTIGYYAMFEYNKSYGSFRKTMYWPKEKMEIHADTYSTAFNLVTYKKIENGQIPQNEMWKYSSFWYKNFDDMAYKTMLRHLISRWGIMSIELQNAIESDMAVINEDGSKDYVDNNNNVIVDTPSATETITETQEEAPMDYDPMA